MNDENLRPSLTLFSNTATEKLSRLAHFLISIVNYGPELEEVQSGYQREVNSASAVPQSWLTQMEMMGLVRVSRKSRTIELRPTGEKVLSELQREGAPDTPMVLIKSFCETFVGLYDTIALVSTVPLRVSQLKTILNQKYDLDWDSKSQAKQRADWLRLAGVIDLNSANEYTLSAEGEEVYNDLRDEYGTPDIQSLLGSGSSVTPSESVQQQANKEVDSVASDAETQTTTSGASDQSITLPFLERTDTKVISVHVPKSNNTDDRYESTVESNETLESDDPLFIEEHQNNSVRYWLCDSDELDNVGGLTRGDAILFHHPDRGYMTITTVLEAVTVDIPISALDTAIYFEEVYDAVVSEEELFELFGWENHPNQQWNRLDQRQSQVLAYEYDSIEAFITEAKGELQFNFWSYENWSLDGNFARHLARQLERKGQVILYGPPGTGKTFFAERFARLWTGKQPGTDPGTYQTESVTFHPSFSYEDFIEGYTITGDGEGSNEIAAVDSAEKGEKGAEVSNGSPYGLKEGMFREICVEATQALEATPEDRTPPRYVLVIDELNRGNVPQIFGEIITLLEKDKRGQERFLSHSGAKFTIPENVFIIATMNTADQSISKLDAALRRRFAAISLSPDYNALYDSHSVFPEDKETAAKLVETGRKDVKAMVAASVLALEIINKRITAVRGLGKGKRIGHAYLHPDTWMSDTEDPRDIELTDVWRYDILPLLEEYFFEDTQQLEENILRGDSNFINETTNDVVSMTPSKLKENLRTFVIDNQGELDIEISPE
ncbi:McrB family protein [Halorubrum distributum]|nr:AAA family ATPase [Halorubrum arcis]